MSPTTQMEQDGDYKAALAAFQELEKLTDQGVADKQTEELIKMIETNIDSCIKALLARKEVLIHEVKEKREQISRTKESCKQLLAGSVGIYQKNPTGAKKIWKTCNNNAHKVEVSFSPHTMSLIEQHGTVFEHQQELLGGAQQAISTWLPNTKLTLLYKASRDGFKSADFHKLCDNKAPTLSVIRSSCGYRFGGFSSVTWNHTDDGYKASDSNFIFTLSNPHGIPPTKYTIKNTANAVYAHSSYGPTFGTGYDFYVASNSNINGNSYSNFPDGYTDTTGKGNTTFTGCKNFICNEVEVYLVE